MNGFSTWLRKEIIEQWRSKRMLIGGIVLLVFGMASPLLAKLTPELMRMVPGGENFIQLIPTPTVNDAIAQYIKNMQQFGLILALLFSMGAVAQEKEKGTAGLMLVKPLGRGAFLLAKFVAINLSLLAGLAAAALGGFFYTLFLFEAPNLAGWVGMNLMLALFFAFIVALTLLCSTLLRSQAAAAGVAVGGLFVLTAIGAIPSLAQYLPGELVNWAGALALGLSNSAWGALGVTLVLILACLLSSWLVLRKQEL
ncbi:MAG TPA: ABC transporter permease subunit [Anaerolineaceae bacterium]|nr:ABC transporter permease subunit [Anaerolineaceae bacterium]